MRRSIETPRLTIIACDQSLLQKALEGNEALGNYLGVTVADQWTEFGTGPLQYAHDKLSAADQQNWWSWFPVHRQDNKLIGSGGYKGIPTDEGIVELGYEIDPAYRNQGLASEFTKALIENAFSNNNVMMVIAHTLAETNPSTRVLQKCGFTKTEEINDPDDGPIWKWELKR